MKLSIWNKKKSKKQQQLDIENERNNLMKTMIQTMSSIGSSSASNTAVKNQENGITTINTIDNTPTVNAVSAIDTFEDVGPITEFKQFVIKFVSNQESRLKIIQRIKIIRKRTIIIIQSCQKREKKC